MRKKYLIRCDGGNIPETGIGHIYRCSILAKELQKLGHRVFFITRNDGGYALGFKMLLAQGFSVIPFKENDSEFGTLSTSIRRIKPDTIIFDRLDTDRAVMQLASRKAVVLTFDDLGEGQRFADMTINATIGRDRTIYNGLDYCVLPKKERQIINLAPAVRNIFISFGGYDHQNITLKTLKALENIPDYIKISLALKKSYPWPEFLDDFLRNSRRKFNIHWDATDISDLIKRADLSLTSGGLTLLESLAAGVPTITINQYSHQEEITQELSKRGALLNLGLGSHINIGKIEKSVQELIENFSLRERLHKNSLSVIDGYGLDRVMELVLVCEKRQWDTIFFKLNIAELYPLRVNEKTMRFALRVCRKDKIRCLYYLCDCHDPQSVKLAEKYGFHFVDIRLTFFLDLTDYRGEDVEDSRVSFGGFKPQDLKHLKRIAGSIYIYSRYYFDLNFPRESCSKFYTNWIEKCCRDKNTLVFVARTHNRCAIGYVTARISNRRAYLDLIGVDKEFSGQKIGVRLLKYALMSLKRNSIYYVEVVTQGRNYSAQRLYQSCGFKTLKTQLWYHKWFNH